MHLNQMSLVTDPSTILRGDCSASNIMKSSQASMGDELVYLIYYTCQCEQSNTHLKPE